MPNVVEIAQTTAKLWWFFDFAKMAAFRHLGFVMRVLDHPRRAFGDLYHCAKFGWSRCSSFDNARFWISQVWLENAYSRPNIGSFSFGGVDPINGEPSEEIPKGLSLREPASFWTIMRGNPNSYAKLGAHPSTGASGHMGEMQNYLYLCLFLGTHLHLQVRPVDGFSRIMAQTTRPLAGICRLGICSHGGRHLEKSINGYILAAVRAISTKFDTMTQFDPLDRSDR